MQLTVLFFFASELKTKAPSTQAQSVWKISASDFGDVNPSSVSVVVIVEVLVATHMQPSLNTLLNIARMT
jgi:hypothetical protein